MNNSRLSKTPSLHHVEQIGICRSQNKLYMRYIDTGYIPNGWLQLSCGFCEYLDASSSRMLLSSCT